MAFHTPLNTCRPLQKQRVVSVIFKYCICQTVLIVGAFLQCEVGRVENKRGYEESVLECSHFGFMGNVRALNHHQRTVNRTEETKFKPRKSVNARNECI